MRRGYTIEEYVECVQRIRDIVPAASLSTDVIAGFCGETEAQFQRTLDLLAGLRFDKVHVAAYSPRPGTIAWRHLEDDVPREEKMRRLHAVEALQERIATEINEALVGTTQEVLVEGENVGRGLQTPTNAPDGAANGRDTHPRDRQPVLTGRTRANKLVHWPRPASKAGDGRGAACRAQPVLGDMAHVRITRAGPWALRGEPAEAAVPA